MFELRLQPGLIPRGMFLTITYMGFWLWLVMDPSKMSLFASSQVALLLSIKYLSRTSMWRLHRAESTLE